jgi:hypothetical protein
MNIRNRKSAWAALAVGALLLTGVGASVHAQECDDCQESGWRRAVNWCRRDHFCRGGHCHGSAGYGSGALNHYHALNGGYCDPRDMQLYAAQGYDVPVAVPLAPVVRRTYNYGWGLPSSRLVRVGAQYTQWYPNTQFSQTGGRLPGQYPVYLPTDTTQQGAYYVHTPRWGRYPGY